MKYNTLPSRPSTGKRLKMVVLTGAGMSAESGVKRTDADNTVDLTYSGGTANSNNETVYYRITNNPGVELPATGGPGTRPFTLHGSILILGAGVLFWRRLTLI